MMCLNGEKQPQGEIIYLDFINFVNASNVCQIYGCRKKMGGHECQHSSKSERKDLESRAMCYDVWFGEEDRRQSWS